MKNGVSTSELWTGLIGLLTTILTSQLPASDALKITAMIVVGVIVVAYIAGRTLLKAIRPDGPTVAPSDSPAVARASVLPVALLLCAGLALCAGCGTTGNHTPFTGMAYDKAIQLAGQDMIRIETAAGPRWIEKVSASSFGNPADVKDINELLSIQAKRRLMAETSGLSERQIGAQYNPGGINWGKAFDWLGSIIVAGGLTYGVSAISASDGKDGTNGTNGKDGEPAKPTVAGGTAPTVVVTSGNGSPVTINVNAGGEGNVTGGGSGGAAAPAEPAVAP